LQLEEDPLWDIVGMFDSGIGNLAEKHDEYIVQWIQKESFAFDRHFLTEGFALVPQYTPRGLPRRHLRKGEGEQVNPAHPYSHFLTNGR
jgi:hypothetical protein